MSILDKLNGDGLDKYCEGHEGVDTNKCKKVLQPIINAKSTDEGDSPSTEKEPESDPETTEMSTDSKPKDVQMMEGGGMEPQPSDTPANDDIQLESVMADCVGDQTVLGIRRGGNEYACRLWAERQNRLISEQDKKLEELRNELN